MTIQGALSDLGEELVAKLNDMEFRCCYAAAVMRSTRKRLRIAKWVVAAAASVPFVTYMRSLSGSTAELVSALAPLVAVALPLWNADKTMEAASRLHGKYSALLPPLRDLWRAVRDTTSRDYVTQSVLAERIRDLLGQTESQTASLSAELLTLPDSPGLKRNCARSVPRYALERIEPPEEDVVMYCIE